MGMFHSICLEEDEPIMHESPLGTFLQAETLKLCLCLFLLLVKVPQSSGTTTPPMTTPPPVRFSIKSVPEIEIGDEVDHVAQPQLKGSHVNIFAVLLLIVCITLLTLMAVASMIFRR